MPQQAEIWSCQTWLLQIPNLAALGAGNGSWRLYGHSATDDADYSKPDEEIVTMADVPQMMAPPINERGSTDAQTASNATAAAVAPAKSADIAEIRRSLSVLYQPGDVVELRMKKARWKPTSDWRTTISGYYDSDHFDDMAADAAALSGQCDANVYCTLNPVKPILLARSNNGFTVGAEATTNDEQIAIRRWLFLDFDPLRGWPDVASGVSCINANGEERERARHKACEAQAVLSEIGWPDPVLADSGNGYHLLWRLEPCNSNASSSEQDKLVREITEAAAIRFSGDGVDVDKTVHNRSRLTKIYGTLSMKGMSVNDRPHRLSRLVTIPAVVNVVTATLIKAALIEMAGIANETMPTEYVQAAPRQRKVVASTQREDLQQPASNAAGSRAFDMAAFIRRHGISTRQPLPYQGGTKWQLESCPFDADHSAPDSCLYVTASGAAAFKCSHNSCSGRDWAAFREIYDPLAKRDFPAPIGLDMTDHRDHDGTDLDAKLALYPLTDAGNADRFVARYGTSLKWLAEQKNWAVWDGQRWAMQVDGGSGEVTRNAIATARKIVDEASTVPSSPAIIGGKVVDEGQRQRQDLVAHAKRSQSHRSIMSMVALAKSHELVRADTSEFDADPWLLVCPNGTIDLKSRSIRPHDPADRITQVIPVVFNPAVFAPQWQAFLDRVMPDVEVRRYVQKFAGYSLTGLTGEQCFLFLHGSGANGKGTYVDVVRSVMGDLHARLASEVVMLSTSTGDAARFGLHGIVGRRLVTFGEVADGQRLNESRLKELTGEDPIRVERKGVDAFEVYPKAKYVMMGNHKPVIRGMDTGIWRRVRLIPFTVTIPEHDRDPLLRSRLIAESSGVLNWMLDGLQMYLSEGLVPPEAVLCATDDYRESSDLLGQFLADECVVERDATESGQELHNAYLAWATRSAIRAPWASNTFAKKLEERGFGRKRTSSNRAWTGLRLLTGMERSRAEQEEAVGRGDLLGNVRLAQNRRLDQHFAISSYSSIASTADSSGSDAWDVDV